MRPPDLTWDLDLTWGLNILDEISRSHMTPLDLTWDLTWELRPQVYKNTMLQPEKGLVRKTKHYSQTQKNVITRTARLSAAHKNQLKKQENSVPGSIFSHVLKIVKQICFSWKSLRRTATQPTLVLWPRSCCKLTNCSSRRTNCSSRSCFCDLFNSVSSSSCKL